MSSVVVRVVVVWGPVLFCAYELTVRHRMDRIIEQYYFNLSIVVLHSLQSVLPWYRTPYYRGLFMPVRFCTLIWWPELNSYSICRLIVIKMMSENKPKCSVVSLAIIVSSLLAIAGSIGGVTNFQALGQQNTTTVSNETIHRLIKPELRCKTKQVIQWLI